MKLSFQKSKNMLNSTNGERVLNSPLPDQNFGEKVCEVVEKKFFFPKP